MPASGGKATAITHERADHLYPTFSPEGRRLAFQRSPLGEKGDNEGPAGTFEIYLSDPAGRSERRMTNLGIAAWPAWSPDGRRIAFGAAKTAKDNFRLYLLETASDQVVPLTDGSTEDFLPAWSPDGHWIAFGRARDLSPNAFDLWRIHPDGTGLQQLTTSPDDENRPAWSPDGMLIAFKARGTITVMDVSGANRSVLTDTPAKQIDPAWSPDGRQLVFAGGDHQPTDIYVINRDGTGLRQLTATPEGERTPAWSPDGRSIIFGK